jgi:hypothetical protein
MAARCAFRDTDEFRMNVPPGARRATRRTPTTAAAIAATARTDAAAGALRTWRP